MSVTWRFFPNWLILLQKPTLGCYGIEQLTSSVSRDRCWGKKESKDIRGYHVYKMTWKTMAGACFQCMKEPTNKVDRILTVKKMWLVMCNKNLHDGIHVFIPAPLRGEYEVITDWKSLRISIFMDL